MSTNTKINVSDLLDKNGKLSFKPITSKNYFLPSPSNVFTGLGFKVSFSSVSKFIENEYSSPLELSDTTKWNVDHSGISVHSVRKIISWFKSIVGPGLIKKIIIASSSLSMLRVSKIASTSSEWLPLLAGFKITLKKQGLKKDFQSLMKFIKDRSKAEYQLLKTVRPSFKDGTLDINNIKDL